MSEDIELNLDTQARRLAELDALISATLNDEESAVEISASPHQQSYEELTVFNNQLREQRDWTTVDLESALTDDQRAAWELWQTKHRLQWSGSDYAAVGVAGLVGFLCSWFDSAIDGAVRDRLEKLADTALVQRWEDAGKQLPIDYMGPGFGGRGHRIKSAGHDLARPFEAISQIMSGEFRGTYWKDGVAVRVVNGTYQGTLSSTEAALKLGQHLLADVITPMSLPIPGMSFLQESNSQVLRDFALHSYNGLGGVNASWNLRSGVLTPSMTVVVTEVLIRTYVHAEAYRKTGSAILDWPQQRRRTELLLAAHGLVSAISLGKVAAQVTAHCVAGDYIRAVHPSHIRHANIPALLRTGTLAATVVRDARRAARIPDARSWDELVIDTAQPWQLDFVDQFETLADMSADGILPL